MIEVSAQEFQKNFGLYQDQAMVSPVTITKHGRPRLVMMSIEQYQQRSPSSSDRVVVRAVDLTDQDLAAIAAAEIPAENVYYSDDLDDDE